MLPATLLTKPETRALVRQIPGIDGLGFSQAFLIGAEGGDAENLWAESASWAQDAFLAAAANADTAQRFQDKLGAFIGTVQDIYSWSVNDATRELSENAPIEAVSVFSWSSLFLLHLLRLLFSL